MGTLDQSTVYLEKKVKGTSMHRFQNDGHC